MSSSKFLVVILVNVKTRYIFGISYGDCCKILLGCDALERSQDWFDESLGDLEHAQNDLRSGFYNWACFSAQQAAEKAVKAVFQKLGTPVWGHSVVDLLEELKKNCDVDQSLIEIAYELDKVYIPTRYPDALVSGSPRRRFTRTEAERMISYAQRIVSFCESLLSKTQ